MTCSPHPLAAPVVMTPMVRIMVIMAMAVAHTAAAREQSVAVRRAGVNGTATMGVRLQQRQIGGVKRPCHFYRLV